MWPVDVAAHAQSALRAATSGSHPEWHILLADDSAYTRHSILAYIAEAYPVRPLRGTSRTDDFKFQVGGKRWFSVRFDDPIAPVQWTVR